MDRACVFCSIVKGDTSAVRVLDEPHVLAFLDVRPLFHGHVLVVPKTHVEALNDVPPDLLPTLFDAVQRMTRAVERGLSADGTFVAMNNRVSQSVPHLHVHVVPRRKKDGLKGFFWPRTKYASSADADAVRDPIVAALAADARHP